MRKISLLFSIFFIATSIPLASPSLDYKGDSTIVQELLDSCRLDSVQVSEVTTVENNRIVTLSINVPQIKVPQSIGDLTTLTKLTLVGEKDSLPTSIGNLSNLIVLDIRNSWLTSIPSTIMKLKKLKIFRSSGNLFCNLSGDFEKWLDALDRPGVDEWRNGQFCLKSSEDSIVVRKLLDTNDLDTLPLYKIASTQKGRISSIELPKKNISILPPDIGNLSALKRLVLPENSISTLPGSVTKLTSLTTLDLYYNFLCSIPDSIAVWIEKYHIPYGDDFSASQVCCIQKDKDVVRAILDMNGLKDNSIYGWVKARNGRIYKIYFLQEIKILPEAIGELDSLKFLYMDKYTASHLPNSFTKLKDLDSLTIWGTLEYLPDNISNLSNLTTIQLGCNLESLPNSIGKLQKLKRLVISSNKLNSLPDSIIKLNNIEYLNFNGNYLCNVSPAIDSFLCKYDSTWISRQWCCNNAHDTLVIRKILDTNQLFTTSVQSVTSAHNGRIVNFNLGGHGIKYLTNQIGDLDSLKRLEIYSNSLTEISSSIGKLSKLQTLELGYNKLKSLPDSLLYCSSLTRIGVYGNWLCNLSDTLKQWITARTDSDWISKQKCIGYQSDFEIIQQILDTNEINNDIWSTVTIENGRIVKFTLPKSDLIIPEYIQNLDSLKKIEIPSSWQVQPIRKDAFLNILKIKNLKELILPTCGIDSLPGEIKNLENLEILNLQEGNLKFISDSIGCLKKLKTLNISSCKISQIPHSIGDCDSLCALYCGNNSLDSLPFEISKCKKLGTFYISNCNLQNIPNSICKLDSIHVLNVNGNILCDVSDSVTTWLDLHAPSWKNKQFCVSDPNEIKIVQELLDVNGLDSTRLGDIVKTENGRITEINIDLLYAPRISQYIHFSVLPLSIGQLTALKKISIIGCEADENLYTCLDSIPETIGLLDSLQELTIVDAQIKKIPESLYNLKSIQTINLQGNQIRTISSKISQLSTLKMLRLNYNKINALPQSIVSLSNLTYLDIGGNAICQLPGTTKIWADQFDPDWATSQTCSEIRNQLYLTSQPIEKNRIAIHWDLSTTHSEADSIDIWYSQSGFPLNPDSSTATLFGTYPVYTFRDTLDTLYNCATNTTYYFSAFQRLGTYTTDTGITAMKAVKAMSTPLLFGHNDISKLSVTYANGTDSVSVYYKLLDYGEQKNVTSLFYRVGMNNVWTKCSELLGDADSVDAADSSVVRCIKWVVRNQLNGTVQTDSLQLMLIAKDMADLQDTLVSEPSVHLDMLPPANVTNFKATAKAGRSISLTWQPSVSPDAIQIMIRYSTDGIWPDSPEKGTALSQTPDTVSSFVISDVLEKVVYRFCVFVKDSANNWSLYSPQASDSVRSLDETNPLELTDMFFTAKQCSTGVLTWQKSLSSDADSIYFVFRADSTYPLNPDSGTLLLKVSVSSPCSLHISNLKSGNALYLAAFVRDSSGNFSNGTNTLLITQPPVCIIKNVSTEVSDTVKIEYSLSDAELDVLSLKYIYSFNGADWLNASIVSETGLLQPVSYNGILQNVKWLSTTDLGNVDAKNVLFKIVVSDNAAGKADPISLNVDNWHNQSISVVSPSTAQTGKVAIHYTISDTTKDTLRIYPYYCKEGTSWRSATTIESPVITAGNYEGQITWSSVADAGAVSSKVRFKIEISDNWGLGKSDSTDLFLLENSMIPFIVQAKDIPSVSSDTNHTVNTTFTVERINKGTIAIKSAFFRTDGEWKEIKSLSGYEIGDTSQNPVVSWQSRSEYTDNSDSVFMKFVFKINLYEVDVIAGPFTLENNYRSAIKIDPITSKQHGDIGISYTISDKDFDPQELVPRYRLSTDSKWKIATVNNSAGIDSAHFKGEIIWKSYSDIPLVENIAVLFKLTPVDQDTGIADSVQFVVSNQGLPVCEKLTIMDSVYKDTITVSYKLFDANNDTLSICLYYYFNGDWKKCTLITGDTTNISPEKYSGILQWVSKSDFENMTSPGIKLKLMPKDSIYGAACETDTFTINNFDPFLNMVGDFNSDKRVDFLDFNYCALYWHYSARGGDNPDSIGDIGPATYIEG